MLGSDVLPRAAADRQHRPDVAEDQQQDEGDDVVGHRVEGHHHAQDAERAALAVVAGQAAQQVAERPGDQRAGEEEPIVQGSARAISTDTGVGNAESDGPKSRTASGQ